MWRKITMAGFPSLASISPGGSFGVSAPEDKKDETYHIQSDSGHDVPSLDQKKQYFKEAYSDRSSINWKDRLKLMWRKDEWENRSPELEFVKQSAMVATFGGFFWGAYVESSKTYRIFLEKHKHTMFEQPREAQVALQDRVIMAMIKGGWKYGWRIGVLVVAYTSVTQSMAAIRNYVNPLDHLMAGGVVGGFWKFSMGPRGMVGGAVAGSIMGIQGGVLMWLLQKASGETIEEKWRREFDHFELKGRIHAAKKLEGDPRLEIVHEIKKGDNSDNSESDESKVRSSAFDGTVKSVVLWTNQKFGIFDDQAHTYNLPDSFQRDDKLPPKV